MQLVSTNTIIKLSREKVTVYKATRKDAKQLFEDAWSLETLEKIVASMVSAVSPRPVKLLLADNVSYVVTGKAPTFTKEKSKRVQMQAIISREIPEHVENEDWDYKLVGKKDSKQFQAFAPVLSLYKPFVAAVTEAGYEIEAVEPAAFAKERNEDPVIGLFMKDDQEGKDENVLNLEVERKEVSITQRKKTIQIIMIISGLLGILVAVLVTIFVLSQQSGSQPEQPSAVVEENMMESEVEEPSPSPELTETIDLQRFSVQVQNGSGQAGLAGIVADQLELAGFDDVETANADSFDYENVSVYFKEDTSDQDAVLSLIEEALTGYTVQVSTDSLDDSEYEIVVIIGS